MSTTSSRTRAASVTVLLVAVVVALYLLNLMVGRTFYPLPDVVAVAFGADVDGANFTVGRLRLPRATLGLLAGASFGLAGVCFQTLLRNPLASPDVIGISAGASTAAVFGIVFFGLSGAAVAGLSVIAALAVAALIYILSARGSSTGTRLILIGIGVAAMLESLTTYVLSKAGDWDLQEAVRWLTGSLNGVGWDQVLPVAVALAVLGPLLVAQAGPLSMMALGEDTAAGLGVDVGRTRLFVVLAAVGLVAFATSAAGPIAFVAFLSGPVAGGLVGHGRSLLLPAALVGAVLVLGADFAGQNLLPSRYPVGIVTGVLGAPYLVYLITRSNRTGVM
ncbi:FecCD family ABC transporter permease [Zhihengliuella halotolerans]|uniref:Iron complex transport system permease protein n=1 Tax=Zhihengliuella halotolerans TaxID=370736 RepID=A0A4Q8AAC8_9MICC|nr:iron chelate uptake ABC transporter family permease subunit [Zhihengliuella halotolerans]RZU60485.1 iron complex transport system permease protein [Zhihengliuella halotolerans]